MNDSLGSYGWSPYFQRNLQRRQEALGSTSLEPGRVVQTQRGRLRLWTARGDAEAEVSGRFRHLADGAPGLPVVGDWVSYAPTTEGGDATAGVVHAILERRNQLSRKEAGTRTAEQVVAANVDLALIVMGLDGDYNLRRLERFLALADESRVRSAVVLNKSDLCADLESLVEDVRSVCAGRPVVAISAREGCLGVLDLLLAPRETVVLLGSSGVGKTTLINRLRGGAELPTRAVRAHDSRGRHTTTYRELFRLPNGCLLVDNPGVREIQLWNPGEGLPQVFDDVTSLAPACRFRDCRHQGEPGCAVARAIEQGDLDPARLESLQSLEREAAALDRRKDARLRRQRGRQLGKLYREAQKEKRSRRF